MENLRAELHLFAWKMIHDILFTRDKLIHLGMDAYGECQFCNKTKQNIDHIFINCDLAFNVWITIHTNCPTPINTNIRLLTGLNFSGRITTSIYGDALEKVFTILWLFGPRNIIDFGIHKSSPVLVLDMANLLF